MKRCLISGCPDAGEVPVWVVVTDGARAKLVVAPDAPAATVGTAGHLCALHESARQQGLFSFEGWRVTLEPARS